MITRDIAACNRLQEIEDVYNEWGSSFNYIHTTAAMVNCAKLSRKGAGTALFQRLAALWVKLLPEAEVWECANVLWSDHQSLPGWVHVISSCGTQHGRHLCSSRASARVMEPI